MPTRYTSTCKPAARQSDIQRMISWREKSPLTALRDARQMVDVYDLRHVPVWVVEGQLLTTPPPQGAPHIECLDWDGRVFSQRHGAPSPASPRRASPNQIVEIQLEMLYRLLRVGSPKSHGLEFRQQSTGPRAIDLTALAARRRFGYQHHQSLVAKADRINWGWLAGNGAWFAPQSISRPYTPYLLANWNALSGAPVWECRQIGIDRPVETHPVLVSRPQPMLEIAWNDREGFATICQTMVEHADNPEYFATVRALQDPELMREYRARLGERVQPQG